jgi:hypothetical protein
VAGAVDADADIDTIKSKTHVPTGAIPRLAYTKSRSEFGRRGENSI